MDGNYLLDDSDWHEVKHINSYAVFMGYLSMAIKGLGFLILTWTTVVLLGGFVSMLHKKDFWCLTFITLVQTAGIFDVALNEKLSHVTRSPFGMMYGFSAGLLGDTSEPTMAGIAPKLLACVLLLVQLVLLVAVLFPLATIYMFGILMSGGFSLWRLIEHDYSDSDGEASNLALAMDTLYYIALIQSAIFCYRFIFSHAEKRLAKEVATKCDESELQVEVVSNYLLETRRGCEMNPSFAKGRNLITHGIDMIGSNSPDDCVSGVRILYTVICIGNKKLNKEDGEVWSDDYREQMNIVTEQRMLTKHLVMYAASSRHILQKLLEKLDSRGLHDRETRHHAAEIVECLASDINLEQFPRGIEHISSMMETFEQYSIVEPCQRDILFEEAGNYWNVYARCLPPSPQAHSVLQKAYKELLLKCLCILRKLAAHRNNCRVISDTPDLVSKIMAPITSDLLHHTTDNHGAWSDIVDESMRVIRLLNAAPGETGAKLRHEISSCKQAINTLWRILNCSECNQELQRSAIWILKQVYMDTESSKTDFVFREESRESFVRMLVNIFTHDRKSIGIREYVGKELWEVLCFGGGSYATIVIQMSGHVVDSLTKVLVHANSNNVCRGKAAAILEHLCTHYTKDDEHLGKLRKAMNDAIPKVLGEILRSGDETHNGKQADQDRFAKPKADIENQCDNGKGKGISSLSSSHPQNNEQGTETVLEAVMQSIDSATFLSSLVSLCGTVYGTFFSKLGPDLAPLFHASSFLKKLKEMVVIKSEHPTVENLLVVKAISKMVISMMKHSGNISVKEEGLQSLIDALSSASKNMLDLDHSMIFCSPQSMCSTMLCSATTPSKLDRCTLASLVKEAQVLHASMMPSTSASG